MNDDVVKRLVRQANAFYIDQEPPTAEQLRRKLEELVVPIVSPSTAPPTLIERAARDYEETHGIQGSIGHVLTANDEHQPWFVDEFRSRLQLYYWSRYREYLFKQGRSKSVIAALDSSTDRIVDLLGDPTSKTNYSRRGLVVGYVQSGKTANYAGVINKAADAGYKVIVVIAATSNFLRRQTQERIDYDVLGFDTGQRRTAQTRDKRVGVAADLRGTDQPRQPISFTSRGEDFNRNTANAIQAPFRSLQEPAVFVIKKNSRILSNLIEWLMDANASAVTKTIREPMLLIDDEADNASINVKHGKNEVSRINGQIRQLLKIFDSNCYVGYTATPFANIFIEPDTDDEMYGDDLFPSDFIYSLEAPDNYCGPDRYFGPQADPKFVKSIDDNADVLPVKHRRDFEVAALPASLRLAVRQFVVARAIWLQREDDVFHSSMLVNVSVYNDVQQQIHGLVYELVENIRHAATIYGKTDVESALKIHEIRRLHSVWKRHFEMDCPDWPSIQKRLDKAVGQIQVRLVNSKSKTQLDYSQEPGGLAVIAVGGYVISRGLTLEGLVTSYFLRRSIMSDTLMQMGRWFGYRDGYDDLCRIWMPLESRHWYRNMTAAMAELRQDFEHMQIANETPRTFGLRVRSHPDALLITARNKMGSAREVPFAVGLDRSLIETTRFVTDAKDLESNKKAAIRLCRNIGMPDKDERAEGGYLKRFVHVDDVITFLSDFKNNDAESVKTQVDPVVRYIRDRSTDELSRWDVLLVSPQSDRAKGGMESKETSGFPVDVRRLKRTRSTMTVHGRVGSPSDEKAGLSEAEKTEAEEEWQKSSKPTRAMSSYWYRLVRQRPLLMLYLLEIEEEKKEGDTEGEIKPAANSVLAWGISFRKTRDKGTTTYYVNTTYWRSEYGEDLEEEDMEQEVE